MTLTSLKTYEKPNNLPGTVAPSRAAETLNVVSRGKVARKTSCSSRSLLRVRVAAASAYEPPLSRGCSPSWRWTWKAETMR